MVPYSVIEALVVPPYRYGLTSRQWGLTLDTVIGTTVVLADGSIVNASASQYQDLFWVTQPFDGEIYILISRFAGITRCGALVWHCDTVHLPDASRP